MAKKQGFRIGIYWEEFGTVEEGGMNDDRSIVVAEKPTKRTMDRIEKALTEILTTPKPRRKRR